LKANSLINLRAYWRAKEIKTGRAKKEGADKRAGAIFVGRGEVIGRGLEYLVKDM